MGFLWTVRETGENRLAEILEACPEEGIEKILSAIEQGGWITL